VSLDVEIDLQASCDNCDADLDRWDKVYCDRCYKQLPAAKSDIHDTLYWLARDMAAAGVERRWVRLVEQLAERPVKVAA